MRLLTALGLVLSGLAAPAFAQPLQPVPELFARVTDLTGTLAPAERSALETKLAGFEERKGAQVAVLIVPTTAPEAIEQYAIRVVDAWQLGRGPSDDGVLLLVAKDDRRLRIEVGRGLEGALTDLVSKRIIDETIVPSLRAGDIAGGIEAGVDRILQVVEGEPLPAPDPRWEGGRQALSELLPLLLLVMPLLALGLRARLGPPGAFLAGGGAAGAAWLLTRWVPIALGFGLFTLLFGLAGSRRRHWSNRGRKSGNGGGWLPGGFGGGGFGGDGGGGFSGGGGSFGGGGASGSW